jgi:hypothetical protein
MIEPVGYIIELIVMGPQYLSDQLSFILFTGNTINRLTSF